MAAEIYLSILLRLVEFTIPVVIAGLALRRLFRSVGFNRIYYIYVAGYSMVAFALLLAPPGDEELIAMMVRVTAWSCLPLWAFVQNEVLQTPGGRYGTDAPEAQAGTDGGASPEAPEKPAPRDT